MKSFGIIGAGVSGISLLGQLVDRLIQKPHSLDNVKIYLIEKEASQLATGMPYSMNNSPAWLINGVPAVRFTLLPGGETLQNWMETNTNWRDEFPTVDADEQFPPRALVGLYFKDQYQKIKEKAKIHGIHLEEIIREVTDVIPPDSPDKHYEILLNEADTIEVDNVMLCFGHLSSDHFQHLIGNDNYIHHPWNREALKAIPLDATVHVIGGHLTFIDVLRELVLTNGFQGNFISVTRNPSLMTVRDVQYAGDKQPIEDSLKQLANEFDRNKDNTLSFEQCRTLFWKAYENAAKKPVKQTFFTRTDRVQKTLSYQLSQEHQQHSSSGDINELHEFIEMFFLGNGYRAMWSVLDEKGKEEFHKHFYSLIVAFVAGIPPVNARLILEMYDKQRIEEKSGLKEITYDNEHQQFILDFDDGAQTQASYLINATGAGRRLDKHCGEYPLLDNLIKRGIIVAAPESGFAVDKQWKNSLVVINPISFFGEKPGLSAVFLSCFTAQSWLDQAIIEININPNKPSCF